MGAAGAVGATLLLSGCLAVDLTTTVSPQATFTGTLTVEFDRAALAEFGIGELAQAEAELGAPEGSVGPVSVEWSQTDTDYQQTISFSDATPEQIDAAARTEAGVAGMTPASSLGFPLTARRSGRTMVVTVAVGPVATPRDARLARALFADSTARLQLTMPGDVVSATGGLLSGPHRATVVRPDPRTLRVVVDLAAVAQLDQSRSGLVVTSRIAAPPASPTATAPTPGSPPPPTAQPADPPVAAAAGLAALVVVAVVVVVAWRRRS